ncbi:hypothetical protein [Planctomyces sp. SH-PL62]|uniref:hypothetical protein n=1 Tax=Planctomyces sp. SH-PL62 TaxID=1636152 RepID=UPI00078D65FD|nr:hypothetical protein [Planctomyces sp. SH-PL62]AMV38796.1 hypothetical protein VT85_15275 [Planctomyces sp. SH-PL62]
MRHACVARLKSAAAVGSTLFLLGPDLGPAQESKPAPADKRPAGKEIASGVILKVEKLAKADAKDQEKSAAPRMRLSINSNAVWRDWARDQARLRDEKSPRRDAAEGAKSVAATGQPADENSVVVVEITDDTRIETRFRSPTDETSTGESSPEKVKTDEGTASKTPTRGKPVKFRAEDLLPGLFVEAQFGPSGARKGDAASVVTVIRPIEVPQTPPADAPSPK